MSGQNSTVNKLHLIYTVIIGIIIILGVLSIFFWGGDSASTSLNNWATAASIVLAVIAIIMTIVDVAGQRNTIADIKDTSQDLKENLNQVNESIKEIHNLKADLMASMKEISDTNSDLTATVEGTLQKFGDMPNPTEGINEEWFSDFKKELENFSRTLRNSKTNLYSSSSILDSSSELLSLDKVFLDTLKHNFKDKRFTIKEVFNAYKSTGFSRKEISKIVSRLVNKGNLNKYVDYPPDHGHEETFYYQVNH